jgi:hypothetical protein
MLGVQMRAQIREAQTELKRNEAEHAALVAILRGWEALLLATGETVKRARQSHPNQPPAGQPSFRSIVRTILQKHAGQPVTLAQIWDEAKLSGASTTSLAPERMVDLLCYSLKQANYPVRKIKTKTWVWDEALAAIGAIGDGGGQ